MKFFVCVTMIFGLLSSTIAQADQLDKDKILRSDEGSIRFWKYDQALKACPPGTHLTTARELASDSVSRGAKGIIGPVVKDGGGACEHVTGCSVNAIDPDSKKDDFTYSNMGIVRSKNPLGENRFWTSSKSGLMSEPYVYSDESGIFLTSELDKIAVRCFK